MAAVDDRRGHLLGLGRGEHEDRVRRRLLERLQERVPGRGREHVRLVEDVDLAAPADRRVGDALAQLADVVDGVVGRGVHLDHVERGGARDRDARVALAARLDRRPALAVQARGEDLRHRGLAGAARAHEQVGVVDLVALDGVAQRAHHRLLADDLGEGAGPVPAVQRRAAAPVAGPADTVAESTHADPSLPGAARGRRGAVPAPADSVRADDRLASGAGSARLRAPVAIVAGAAAAAPDRGRRLRQLRHPVRARLGRAAVARADARVRRADRAHAPPAARAARRRALAARARTAVETSDRRARLPRAGRPAAGWSTGSARRGSAAPPARWPR